MKLLILLLTTNVVGGGSANAVVSYEQIKTEYTRAIMDIEKINLTTQKMNSVNVDLTYLSGVEHTKEDIMEAVVVEIVVENTQHDWINDFLESYLLSNNNSWSTIGINFELPEENTSIDYKARFLPKYDQQFEGVMAVDITLSNGNHNENPTPETELSDLISNTELGKLEDNNPSTIKDAILIKNKNANGTEFIIDENSITKTSAMVYASPNGGFVGSLFVNFAVKEGTADISTVITNTNLGVIENNNSSTIKDAILSNNSEIVGSDFTVESITNTSAIAKATENSNYHGQVSVSFTIKAVEPEPGNDLDDMIGSLGELPDIKEYTILEKFAEVNSEFKIDTNDLKISNVTYTSALITPKNDKYTGSIELTYRVESQLVSDGEFETRETSVESYSNFKHDEDKITITYDIKTDVDNFKNHFGKLKFNYSGYFKNQEQTGWNESYWEDKTDEIEIDWNNLPNGVIWKEQNYIGAVNDNWNKILFTMKIDGSKLTFEFKVVSEAKASGWNVYYSRAKAKLSVKDLTFIS